MAPQNKTRDSPIATKWTLQVSVELKKRKSAADVVNLVSSQSVNMEVEIEKQILASLACLASVVQER